MLVRKKKLVLLLFVRLKENNARCLKDSMYEAVVAYGETGKSGNKVINLIDSKLYTKKTEVVTINADILLTFKDLVFDQFRELYNNDMLNISDANVDSLDPQGFIDVINAKFKAEYPERAERMMEEYGRLFVVEDLMLTNIKFETSITLYDLLGRSNFRLLEGFFDTEHLSNVVPDISKTVIKNMLKDGIQSSFANLDYNESLIIK